MNGFWVSFVMGQSRWIVDVRLNGVRSRMVIENLCFRGGESGWPSGLAEIQICDILVDGLVLMIQP